MAPAEYCPDCRRILGVGCACGLTFAEKVGSVTTATMAFKAVTNWRPALKPVSTTRED